MASWQNVTLTKCQADEMASRKNDELIKCQADETAKHQMFHDFYRGQSDPLYSESPRLELESVQHLFLDSWSNSTWMYGCQVWHPCPFFKTFIYLSRCTSNTRQVR